MSVAGEWSGEGVRLKGSTRKPTDGPGDAEPPAGWMCVPVGEPADGPGDAGPAAQPFRQPLLPVPSVTNLITVISSDTALCRLCSMVVLLSPRIARTGWARTDEELRRISGDRSRAIR
jgi:hypothetical protein